MDIFFHKPSPAKRDESKNVRSSLPFAIARVGEEECEESKLSSYPFAVARECEERFFFFHQVPRQRDEDKEEIYLFDRLVFDSTNKILFDL
jgi:hypothetical protein